MSKDQHARQGRFVSPENRFVPPVGGVITKITVNGKEYPVTAPFGAGDTIHLIVEYEESVTTIIHEPSP